MCCIVTDRIFTHLINNSDFVVDGKKQPSETALKLRDLSLAINQATEIELSSSLEAKAITAISLSNPKTDLLSNAPNDHNNNELEENINSYANEDALSIEEREKLYNTIRNYIDTNGVDNQSESEKEELIQKIMTYYARSSNYYGPVVIAWVDYLLSKANNENKKLIFLARDGIAPYKMAKTMMKIQACQMKFPCLSEDRIQLAYLSRKVINKSMETNENTVIFQKYISQLGLNHKDHCIFVDIGFTGSMIPKIKQMLPDIDIEFEFLISHGPRANGFIFSYNDPRLGKVEFQQMPTIQTIPYAGAGGNFATHWLEDTHQGVEKSPESLVEVNGIIYPNTKIPGNEEFICPTDSLEYHLRSCSQEAILESFHKFPIEKIDIKKVVKQFDVLLTKIANSEISLLITHTKG